MSADERDPGVAAVTGRAGGVRRAVRASSRGDWSIPGGASRRPGAGGRLGGGDVLGYDEIAVALGGRVGTVRSRLHRARAKLQRALPTLDPAR
ncbi:MAG: sigma factor-like helix-turn-helix DNA-binding protein [Solirubrobacteraceae bacterium]